MSGALDARLLYLQSNLRHPTFTQATQYEALIAVREAVDELLEAKIAELQSHAPVPVSLGDTARTPFGETSRAFTKALHNAQLWSDDILGVRTIPGAKMLIDELLHTGNAYLKANQK